MQISPLLGEPHDRVSSYFGPEHLKEEKMLQLNSTID